MIRFNALAGSLLSPSRPGRVPQVMILCLFLMLAGCGAKEEKKAGEGKPKPPPVPVSVALSLQKDVPVEVEAIGVAEAFASVGIKSQVAGILEKVHFKEGAAVKAGDLLFSIDARPFAARLAQAQAALAKDRAALENARKQAQRYAPAAEKGYVSVEQSDQAQTSVATLAAAVQADEAAVESARLDIQNCLIRTPLSGNAGELSADQGNLIKSSADQPLVTVNQVAPIKVVFSLPENTLPELKRYLGAGHLDVVAVPSGENVRPLTGRLSFLDNAVDSTTGTIRLKAEFANADRSLWPGQYANVRLLFTTRRAATVVPVPAVQTGQNGTYVYVVKKDSTVELRPVTVGFSRGDESVIEAGLEPAETVVTDGQLRLSPGATIKPVEAGAGSGGSEAAK